MAKTQARRSISINGAVYERARRVAEKNGVSLSSMVQALLDNWCVRANEPVVDPGEVRRYPTRSPRQFSKREQVEHIAAHFTF